MSILAVYNVLDNECHVSWFDFDHPYWFFLSYLSVLSSLQGDFLVHFMDIAREELTKKPEEIFAEKLQVCLVLCVFCVFVPWQKQIFCQLWLWKSWFSFCFNKAFFVHFTRQSLLDIALRSTAAASDPSHEELICCVVNIIWIWSYYMMFYIIIFVYICVQQERSSLLKKLATLKDLDCAYPADKLAAADVDQSMQLSITGLETFCLSNKVFYFNSLFKTFLMFVLW